jgi:hypothetical protein
MADPINGTAAISSLIRAQAQAPLTALKSNQDNAIAFANQLQKAVAPAKASGVTLPSNTASLSGNLPRGSLVDRLV